MAALRERRKWKTSSTERTSSSIGKLLAETTDEQKRQTLLKLLSDEEAKDAQLSEKKQD